MADLPGHQPQGISPSTPPGNPPNQGSGGRKPAPCPLPAGCLPRGLSRSEAASYCGISPSLLDRAVKDGLLPPPRRCYGRSVWDRHEIDLAMDGWPHAEGKGLAPDNGDNPWG